MVIGLLLIRFTGLLWLDQLFAIVFAVALATAWVGSGIGKLRTEFNIEAGLPARCARRAR